MVKPSIQLRFDWVFDAHARHMGRNGTSVRARAPPLEPHLPQTLVLDWQTLVCPGSASAGQSGQVLAALLLGGCLRQAATDDVLAALDAGANDFLRTASEFRAARPSGRHGAALGGHMPRCSRRNAPFRSRSPRPRLQQPDRKCSRASLRRRAHRRPGHPDGERRRAHRVQRRAAIAAEVLATLFQPNRPGRALKSSSQGVGLGLHIVEQIARVHGGAVSAQSTGGRTQLEVEL
jgi:hypothetical protein